MRTGTTASYVICTALRSGSWMLCSALAKTGVAGNPQEFFGLTLWEEIMTNRNVVGARAAGEYMDRMIERCTSGNGAFGMKLPANHTDKFLRRASEHHGREYLSLHDALEGEFSNLTYLWLTRTDKAAQAVSLYRASMTNEWRRFGQPPHPALATLPYDRFGIERCYQEVAASDAYWEGFFKKHSIEPLAITYEALASDYEPTMRRILQFLGLPWHIPIPAPDTERQADDLSRTWRDRFVSEGPLPAETWRDPERFFAPW